MKETSSAWDTIQALRALQEIDNEIHSVAEERGRLRNRLDQLNDALARGREDLSARRRKISDAEAWYAEQLTGLKTEREKIARKKQMLASVTKSKDYMSIQRELEVVRQMVTEKEEELERFTAALESHKSAVADEESKLSNLEDEAKREEEATQDRLNDFDGRIGSISERRTEWVDRIPPDVLRRYERVKSRREGVAITRIVEGRCSGCHINVPPQLQNVLARRDSLEICPQCNRYIYTPEDEDEDE